MVFMRDKQHVFALQAFPGVHILDNTSELSVVICLPESAHAAYGVLPLCSGISGFALHVLLPETCCLQ